MTRMLACGLALWSTVVVAYPLDAFQETGIRRLEYYRLAQTGEARGPRFPSGQQLTSAQIRPGWAHDAGTTLPEVDAEFSAALTGLLDKAARPDYGIAVLDLSIPGQPRYGVHQADLQANAGSVGKILVALALFHQLAQIYPQDINQRARILRETRITADAFSQYDHHVVPFYDPETRKRAHRPIRIGDQASLWEYLDWMMSASSNSAAAMVQKELIALRHFGERYPVSAEEKSAFFTQTSRKELGEIYQAAQTAAVTAAGLDPAQIRQGSFFTRTGNQRVASSGRSHATPTQLVRYLFRLEAGTLIDPWTSVELKRLLYMTQRRIRYASHPALHEAAVYFKSGSYFQCHEGPRNCRKYRGDKTNRLASVAIVESPAENPRHRYLVAVMSNVLLVNSAVAHQTLAMRVHRLIERWHQARTFRSENNVE